MKNLSLKQKLLFSYSLFLVAFVVISIGYWLIQFKLEQNNTEKERLSIFCETALSSYDEILRNINPTLYMHVNNPHLEELLLDSSMTSAEKRVELSSIVTPFIQNSPFINSVHFIQNNSVIHIGESDIIYDFSRIRALLPERDGIPLMDDPVTKNTVERSLKYIPVYKEMFGSSGTSIGIIVLNLDASKVFSRIDNYGNDNLHMIVLGSSHSVIYKSNHRALYYIPEDEVENTKLNKINYKGQICYTSQKENYSLWGIQEPLTNWIYLIHYTEGSLTRNVGRNVLTFIGISLTAFLIMSAIAWYISSTFTKNVHLFTDALQNSRNTTVPEKISEDQLVHDEIGDLIREYNKMIDRLMVSQKNEYISKIHSQNMQIKMLSYQINPHFLYNCLNLISSLAIIDNVPRISYISKTMGEMYRYTLHHDDMVQIRDELEQLLNYIEIQKIRFHNNFDIVYDISPDLLDMPCMKFILQPIVENSFIHGFTSSLKNYISDGLTEKPRIEIVIFEEANIIHITCTDNGNGIPKERLSQIREELSKSVEGTHESLGLWNIHQRISTYYGPEYGITIDSIENKYTTIALSYPETIIDSYEPNAIT